MSLLPDNATFHERVEACFVAYRGRGVSLSAADLELVDAWAAAGAPFEVVARGIRKAAEAALWDAPEGAGHLRSLRAARRAVEGELAKFLKRTAGAPAPDQPDAIPFHLERAQRLARTLATAAKAQPQLLRVGAHLATLPAPTDLAQTERREELALALLWRTLTFPQRLALGREARGLTSTGHSTREARLQSLRFHRGALIRHHYSLPTFW